MALTPLEVEAIMLSLRVAGWAVLISLPLGIAVAWLLARHRFPGWAVVNGLVHLPLVLPPVVVGFVLLLLLGRQGPLGAWLDDWFGIHLGLHLAGCGGGLGRGLFPLMVRASGSRSKAWTGAWRPPLAHWARRPSGCSRASACR